MTIACLSDSMGPRWDQGFADNSHSYHCINDVTENQRLIGAMNHYEPSSTCCVIVTDQCDGVQITSQLTLLNHSIFTEWLLQQKI